MTDVSMADLEPRARTADAAPDSGARMSDAVTLSPGAARSLLIAAIVAAAAAGVLAASPDDAARAASHAGAELTMLLRFMASVKAVLALAAVGLVAWRFAFPTRVPVMLAYAASAALMSASAGLIWQIAFAAAGALAFHAGLLVFLSTAWADRGQVVVRSEAMVARSRRHISRSAPHN